MSLTSLAYLDLLLGDADVAALLRVEADMDAMLRFEAALARAEAATGFIPQAAVGAIAAALDGFKPDLTRLTAATLRDGVPVPDLVAQLREAVGPDHGKWVHFGATSQDVVDTALALRLKGLLDLFASRLDELDRTLANLLDSFGTAPLMGRSRMQAAIPITSGDRIRVWRSSLARLAAELPDLRNDVLILSLAGAAGTAEKFGDKIGGLRQSLAEDLGLAVPDYVPHADRGRIAKLADWLSRVTGALGKIGQDAALMAQNGIDAIKIAGSGGSSAMPHKQNPVRAEVLVALAGFNATELSAVHQALIHEQERSGSAWTLEWLVLPRMLETTGTALLHAQSMLAAVERIGDPA
ncbi:3-carboxy-cis,cis-muconate cycloisomerase [Rhizobium sp. RU36D]|uniref:3-carboxy-cis,cis-muconate cycloisomerase n=1 Tax=Rhizobium sp. RU36D TaxID=1907415 RepID=UPI0009D8786B|nr:3-carboxy-cis,cis-muconate cycloisomerase [Rhizobium sp. RU36D]SMD10303.1 3-carboxy-cis,cis-muconate cycloisomerase [Rhizobium sp. RU36D]